jgi:heme exporter protein A
VSPPPAAPTIEAVGLSKRFGPVTALDRVDLQVASGEAVALFGANGAGKTTLLRIVSLGLRPSAGTLRVDGLDPRRDDLEIRRRIGLISHASYLYDDLTARQNLEFWAALYGVDDPAERARELLDTLGLAPRADDAVGALSRGLVQRLSLARAIVHDPPLVLLDEPFAGLDPQAVETLRRLLARLRERGRTVLLVTHDLRQGLALTDRFLVLAGGRVSAQGPSAVTDPARLSAEHFERPIARPARLAR